MEQILIKNGRIWDGNRFLIRDILTEDNKIAQIAPSIDCKATYTFDATGKTVSAGLVDGHTHLRGVSIDKYGMQAEAGCFPFGVTAAVDAGGELGDRALADSFLIKNRIFVCAKIRQNKADLLLADRLAEKYGEKAIGFKVYFSAPEVLSTAPLREICQYAHSRQLPVMVHCTGSPVPMADLLDCLAPGDILTHAFHGGTATAADDNFESLKAAQKRSVIVDTGFAGHVHTDFAVLRSAVAAGVVPDIISSDLTRLSAFKRGGRYGLTLCMSIARTAGWQEEDIFRAVTSTPADVFHTNWGRLTPGGCADIAVLDYTHEGFSLTDKAGNRMESPQGYRCILTVCDGQIVYRN